MAFVSISPAVRERIAESDIYDGLVLVNSMHIMASVFINDDEAGLQRDYDEFLETLVPQRGGLVVSTQQYGWGNVDAPYQATGDGPKSGDCAI